MKSSRPLAEAIQTDLGMVPQKAAGKGSAVPKSKRRRLRQLPAQHGTSFSPEQIATLIRFASGIQAAMLAPAPMEAVESTTARTLSNEEAAVVTRAILNDEFRRVPKSGNKKLNRPAEFCPRTGLNRNQLYELFDLRENGRPVIKNVSLKEDGEKNGARLYNVGSVIAYLHRLAEIQAQAESAKT
jgi:hypothetical protein